MIARTSGRVRCLGMLLTVPSLLLCGSLLAPAAEPVQTTFDRTSGEFQIAWPGRVARHDVVYQTPPWDPMQGMPLGNGDVGALVWTEGSKLLIQLNKCDLWDGSGFEHFGNWNRKTQEQTPAVRHAGRIAIDFGLPVYDLFYLSDCDGRLSLPDAHAALAVNGPFGPVSVRLFVSDTDGTVCCQVQSDLREDVPIQVTIERFGSRAFQGWYSNIHTDPNLGGLQGTEAVADARGAAITHPLTSGKFSAGFRIVDQDKLQVAYARPHSHAAQAIVTGGARKHFTVLAAVTAPEESDPVARLQAKLDTAAATGVEKLRLSHEAAWKAFWLRSLMDCGDDYLDNLWHLTMYYANASQRGAYPGRFIHGLWGWNRDVQQWLHYFHWNQQQVYWPLNAAGHSDLCESYLNWRFAGLPGARAFAEKECHAPGAAISDVTDRFGNQSREEVWNHTPVAQVAVEFWRQYQYTGDRAFLKEKALPFLLEASRFFASLFEKGPDGLWHAKEGSAYECVVHLRDSVTELACGEALFRTTLQALAEAGVEEPEAAHWREILDHLAPMATASAAEDGWVDAEGRIVAGDFAGEKLLSGKLFITGYGLKAQKWLRGYPGPKGHAGDETVASFPKAEIAAVFPTTVIGLADRDSERYRVAADTVRLYSSYALCNMGWDATMIAAARLGLTEGTWRSLRFWPDPYQHYPNGWGHYMGPRPEEQLAFGVNAVRDLKKRKGPTFPFPQMPFRHMGMESMSCVASAMNEALLQSYDGTIRVAPALAEGQKARFQLHATGGFVVSAEAVGSQVAWVAIRSRQGKPCRLANPWPKVFLFRGERAEPMGKEAILEIPTQPGELILLGPRADLLQDWQTVAESPEPNRAIKHSATGKATLGLPRNFATDPSVPNEY